MKVLLRGGVKDGLMIELHNDVQSVRIPFIPPGQKHSRVLHMDEFEDPENWEIDPLFGHLRLKRPEIHLAEYHRTEEVVDGAVVFS